MKVYFDVITNHTADVIRYQEGAAPSYISKDQSPYRRARAPCSTTATSRAGARSRRWPRRPPPHPLSFPYHPFVPDAERRRKVPAWLNDVRLYHNRGNTTFVGENSQYGDFFGLDDLFTEDPKVVNGMIDIYKFWIREFRVDGFRMDTMKHVDDAFWQKFAPEIERYARSQGIRDFYMFGEVAEDFEPAITSHYPIHDDVQGVLDFLFQMAAVDFAGKSLPTDSLRDFFLKDDWYTDGDSNAYNLPTFLGNHDRGRIGMFVRNNNPGADEAELLRRDRLAHALMYFSRGNPVIYYGDEQGFTGAGGDQDARQDMFPRAQYDVYDDSGRAPERQHRLRRDADGRQLRPRASAVPPIDAARAVTAALPDAARRRAAASLLVRRPGSTRSRASTAPGASTSSRSTTRRRPRRRRSRPTCARPVGEGLRRGPGPAWSGRDRKLDVSLPALSAVVYRAKDACRAAAARRRSRCRSRRGPRPARGRRATRHRRVRRGDVPGEGRQREVADIGTDDNAPYRVFHDVSDIAPGTTVQYRAVVLDNAHHTRSSARPLDEDRAAGAHAGAPPTARTCAAASILERGARARRRRHVRAR